MFDPIGAVKDFFGQVADSVSKRNKPARVVIGKIMDVTRSDNGDYRISYPEGITNIPKNEALNTARIEAAVGNVIEVEVTKRQEVVGVKIGGVDVLDRPKRAKFLRDTRGKPYTGPK